MWFLRYPAVRLALIAILGAHAIFLGAVPATQKVGGDFPNYYTAGKIAARFPSKAPLYDDAWYQEQIHREGLNISGKFSPFPPMTALLCMPLAPFSPLTALRIVTVINLLFAILAAELLSRCLLISRQESLLLVLFSGEGLTNCFLLGQAYIAVSLAVILGYYLYLRGNKALAGVCLGFFVPIKYFPAVFMIYFAWKKEYLLLLSSGLTAALLTAASLGLWGWEIHKQFLTSVLGNHLLSNLSMQNPYSTSFQSIDGLFRRLFVTHALHNPKPWLAYPAAYWALKPTLLLVLTLMTLRVLRKAMKNPSSHPLILALPAILILVVAPATSTYNFLLLWLPLGLLMKYFTDTKQNGRLQLTWILYMLLGFIPYGLFRRFDGQGVLTLLAYPRLFLMLGLLAIGTGVKDAPCPQESEAAPASS